MIARSNEAKALGIPMGAPLFKIRKLVEEHGVIVRSSNYALYGDISERVMSVLGSQAPAHEIYSIDECFLDLDRMAVADLTDWCRNLRRRTHQWTGIPVPGFRYLQDHRGTPDPSLRSTGRHRRRLAADP